MVSSGLAPYKLPRALDSLLLYQQPSSTTLYYSYQERLSLTEAGLRNETGEITDNTINHTKGTCCPLSASLFPEDCVRLKLSSTRASQAGLRGPPVLLVYQRVMCGEGKLQTLPVLVRCGIISTYGHSSVGRAQVSKTWCRGFESLCPCHIHRPPFRGVFI